MLLNQAYLPSPGNGRFDGYEYIRGKGANAQEQSYIINSRLEGNDITAHGAKIIEADLAKDVFVGFNCFLRGRPESRLTIGKERRAILGALPDELIGAGGSFNRREVIVPSQAQYQALGIGLIIQALGWCMNNHRLLPPLG